MDNVNPYVVTVDRNGQQIFSYPGDPNGHVFAPSPAICIDTLNNKLWLKVDGLYSNTGWQ